jgi:hypothetical protein
VISCESPPPPPPASLKKVMNGWVDVVRGVRWLEELGFERGEKCLCRLRIVGLERMSE